jgi:hypothetical protein
MIFDEVLNKKCAICKKSFRGCGLSCDECLKRCVDDLNNFNKWDKNQGHVRTKTNLDALWKKIAVQKVIGKIIKKYKTTLDEIDKD